MKNQPGVLVVLLASIVLLAAASAYSSYVASQNHANACARTGLILDVFHDVIQKAVTPSPGRKLTPKQATSIAAFESYAFTRIDQARC